MPTSVPRLLTRRPRRTALLAATAVALTLLLVGANPAVSQSRSLTAYRTDEGPGLDPESGAWNDAATVELPLTAQGGTSVLGTPTATLDAQAVHSGGVLYVRMSWDDDTQDDQPFGVDAFGDAAAVEFPSRAASSVPALCMGQADGGVNIWHWRAGNQEGLPESIDDLSATGYVDRYPSVDDLYFPARAAGNPVAFSAPVQDLVSVGFGTLTPAADQAVQGIAEWSNDRWSVVFARELSFEAAEQVDLGEGASADIAFAIWDGSRRERDGIKSVSQFVTLEVAAEGVPRSTGVWLVMMFGVILAVAVLAVGLDLLQERSIRRRVPREPGSAST